MSFKLPSNLHRNRHGTLYLRLAVPVALRSIVGRAEIYRSLGTGSVKQATFNAEILRYSLRRAFQALIEMSDGQEDGERQRRLLALIAQRRLDSTKADYEMEHEETVSRLTAAHQRELELVRERAKVGLLTAHDRGRQTALEAIDATRMGAAAASSAVSDSAARSPLLSVAIAAFVRMKKVGGNWSSKTEAKNRAALALFLLFMGDRIVAEVRSEALIEYLELLKRLPANINKLSAARGKTLHEIAMMGLAPLSPKSVSDRMDCVTVLFKWCMTQRDFGVTHNPAGGVTLATKGHVLMRESFSDKDLIALFSSSEYQKRTFEAWYAYWLVPLGLFTGARLGELCQLFLSDFVEVEGVHCIKIRDGQEGQTLKNSNARRIVPIHSKLIELGLLRHVERAKAAGQVRLFPEISFAVSTSHTASKWFGRFRKRSGVDRAELPFHSFRHTFISRLANAETQMEQIAPIVGHAASGITAQTYWNVKDIANRRLIIQRFSVSDAVMALIPTAEQVAISPRNVRQPNGK